MLNRKYVHNLAYRVLYSSALIVLTYPIALSSQSKEKLETFETWAAKAAAAREAGHTAEAIEAYQHTVALRPGWEEGWWYLGTLNYDNEHFAEANKALRKVVELDPRLGPAWAFLGLGEFETQDYKASFNHLQRARGLGFAENPEVSKVALYHLGLLFNLNGEFEKSTELLVTQFGTSVFPEQIKTAMGMALLRVPLLPDHVDPAKDALVHAAGETAALLANHKTDDAFASFEQVLAQYPDTPYVHYAYGMALALASRYKDAESQLNQESKITKTRALPWIGLATVFLRQERGKDAEAAARHAVQLEPKSPASYDVLSRALQLMGKSDEAETARTKAKNLVSTPVLPDIVQAKRYELGSTQDIFSTMASSAAARPKGLNDNFDDLARRAESARSAGNIVAATQLYEAALQLHPEWGEGWRSVGTFAYMNGRFAEAITDLRRSVTLDTRQAEAWTVLGLSEFQTKDYKNSLIHLKRGNELGFGGNQAAIQFARYHLALMLNLNGEFDQALALLVPEVGAGPPSEEVQFVMGIALLRIAKLPDQFGSADRQLALMAGRAATLLSESRYDQAFPIFEQLIREHPDTPFLHFAYGSALASSSNYDRAQAELLEETRLNPSSALPYVRLASISLVLHQSQEALRFSNKAVAVAPESAETHYMLGRSLLETGDAQAAVNAFEISRRLAPGSPEVHFNLARAYAKIHRSSDADREREEFEHLQAQDPKNSQETMGRRSPHSHDAMAGETISQPDSK